MATNKNPISFANPLDYLNREGMQSQNTQRKENPMTKMTTEQKIEALFKEFSQTQQEEFKNLKNKITELENQVKSLPEADNFKKAINESIDSSFERTNYKNAFEVAVRKSLTDGKYQTAPEVSELMQKERRYFFEKDWKYFTLVVVLCGSTFAGGLTGAKFIEDKFTERLSRIETRTDDIIKNQIKKP